MRRRVGLSLAIAVLLPLVAASSVWAQGARLQLSPSTARPGDLITVTGAGYNQASTNVRGVEIRLSTRDSPPIAEETIPLADGTITVPHVEVPRSLAPGEYLVIGTQVSVRGRHMFGSPGRAKLRVVAASGGAAAPGRSPGAPPTAAIIGAILALTVLAGSTTLMVRRLRTLDQPLGS